MIFFLYTKYYLLYNSLKNDGRMFSSTYRLIFIGLYEE